VSVGEGGVRPVTELTPDECAAIESNTAAAPPQTLPDVLGRIRMAVAGALPPAAARMAAAARTGRRLALVTLLALPFLAGARPLAAQAAGAATPAATQQGGQVQTGTDAVLGVAGAAL